MAFLSFTNATQAFSMVNPASVGFDRANTLLGTNYSLEHRL
jgi:hypothetical protein